MTEYSYGCGVDTAYVTAPAGSRDGGVAAAHHTANAGADELEWMEICVRTNADAVRLTDVLGAGTSEGLEALPGLTSCLYLWDLFRIVTKPCSHGRAACLSPVSDLAFGCAGLSQGLLLASCSSTKSHARCKP